jgi:hypothetical protein
LRGLTAPPTATIPANAISATFAIATGVWITDQSGVLTAAYNGSSQSVSLSLGAASAISSLNCDPTTLGANAEGQCTVTLSRPAAGAGESVALNSTGLPGLIVPAVVPVTSNSTTGPFTVHTGAVTAEQNGTLTASYNNSSQTLNVRLASALAVSSLHCDPATLGANAVSHCTVTLSKPATAPGAVVMLNSDGVPSLTAPASVRITAGSITGPFTARTGAVGTDQNGTLTATYNGTSQSETFKLTPDLMISSLECSAATLGANSTSDCTVTLSSPAPANGVSVLLSNNELPGLEAPVSLFVTAGSTSGTFSISSGAIPLEQYGKVTASYADSSKAIGIRLTRQTVISGLQCSPSTLGAGSTSECKVTLSRNVPEDGSLVTLSSSGLPSLGVPASVSLTAGSIGLFTVNAGDLAGDQNGTVTAVMNGTSRSVHLNLSATTAISSVECSPAILGANAASNCTVILSNPAPEPGATIELSTTGLSNLSVPETVSVPPGSATITFTASTGPLTGDQRGALTAVYNGSSKTANVSVSAETVISEILCSVTTLRSHVRGNCTVRLSAAVEEPATIALTSKLPGTAVPEVMLVPAGTATGSFEIVTSNIDAYVTGLVTAAYKGSSQSVTLRLSED